MLAKKEGKIEYGGGEEDKRPPIQSLWFAVILLKRKKKKGGKMEMEFCPTKKNKKKKIKKSVPIIVSRDSTYWGLDCKEEEEEEWPRLRNNN